MSSTLWATPSMEWTIAPKPKPGRKPKSDTSLKDSNDADSKARRVQNRTAQRAFRERKQSQLTELQDRVRSYEQGQVERNVALQNIAKRLKEENEALRRENEFLREKIAKVEGQETTPMKNSRERSPDLNVVSEPVKRARLDASTLVAGRPCVSSGPFSIAAGHPTYPPATYQTGTSNNGHDHVQAIEYAHAKLDVEANNGSPSFGCGFCNDVVPCLCRAIAEEGSDKSTFKSVDYHQPSAAEDSVRGAADETLRSQISILDNLPAYQPPVPLPRKPGATESGINSIFPLVPPQSQTFTNATCTGDPSNCPACADDTFGKAFCAAIGESVASQSPCANCPARSGVVAPERRCCGDPNRCGSRLSMQSSTSRETMPTNEAWKQIKAHPNTSFADLSLLAEVVARRSKCTGPTVVISPPLGQATPERLNSPRADSQGSLSPSPDIFPLTGNPSQPHIASQDFAVHCGQKKVREVYTTDVQNALHLLDTRSS